MLTTVTWSCLQVPVLDINDRSKHIRQRAGQPAEALNNIQKTAAQSQESDIAMTVNRERHIDPLMHQRRPGMPTLEQSLEQSLDEYCFEFLDNASLNTRDGDQVLSRYLKNTGRKLHESNANFPQFTEEKFCNEEGQSAFRSDEDNQTHVQDMSGKKKLLKDCDEILVVSRFWIWVFGGMFHVVDPILKRCHTSVKQRHHPHPVSRAENIFTDFVITNYGGVSTDHLHQLILFECVASVMRAKSLESLDDATSLIKQCILQQCAKHEPFLPTDNAEEPSSSPAAGEISTNEMASKQYKLAYPRSKVRPLDGAGSFASETAIEVCARGFIESFRLIPAYPASSLTASPAFTKSSTIPSEKRTIIWSRNTRTSY